MNVYTQIAVNPCMRMFLPKYADDTPAWEALRDKATAAYKQWADADMACKEAQARYDEAKAAMKKSWQLREHLQYLRNTACDEAQHESYQMAQWSAAERAQHRKTHRELQIRDERRREAAPTTSDRYYDAAYGWREGF